MVPLKTRIFFGSVLFTGVNVKNSTYLMKGAQQISVKSKIGFILCNL